MVAILVLLTVIVFLTADYFVQRSALRKALAEGKTAALPRRVTVRAPAELGQVPGGVFLGPGHAWVTLDPAGAVRVGTDRLATTLLGGVDRLETVPAGTHVHRGERLALLTKGERSVELRSPVDGLVTATNPELPVRPERLARHPFDSWLVTLAPEALAPALKRLFIAEEARAFMRRELSRLRDGLLMLTARLEPAPVTLPDGGLPVAGIAAELPEEAWHELAESFFDPAAEPSW